MNFNGILWPHVSVGTLVPDADAPPIGAGVWGDTRLDLAALGDGAEGPYRDAFTGMTLDGRQGIIPAAQLFERFPVALLTT